MIEALQAYLKELKHDQLIGKSVTNADIANVQKQINALYENASLETNQGTTYKYVVLL